MIRLMFYLYKFSVITCKTQTYNTNKILFYKKYCGNNKKKKNPFRHSLQA